MLAAKMFLLQSNHVKCPYCWESIELLIDNSINEQQYTEDCHVCCQPITVSVVILEDTIQVEVKQENE